MSRGVHPEPAGATTNWLPAAGRRESGGGEVTELRTVGAGRSVDPETGAPVTFTYEELAGTVEEWTDARGRRGAAG